MNRYAPPTLSELLSLLARTDDILASYALALPHRIRLLETAIHVELAITALVQAAKENRT